MWYRIVIGSLSVMGIILLFASQFRLSNKLGRREDEAEHHRMEGAGSPNQAT